MRELCADLDAEQAAVDRLVADLDEPRWSTMTPSEPWTVRDQIAHLAYFDEAARLAATDAEAFARDEASLARDDRALRQLDLGRRMTGPALLAYWRDRRAALLDALRPLDIKDRLPWYGPSMSALSFATARLEETWGHGQDIADALGVEREATDRLRHVAHLGVITRRYSFENQGLEVPPDDVRVELTAPSGAVWTWGDERATNRVRGLARDFCLVVTRRRHVRDTDLVVEGPVAREWMLIAQAFAGPPGHGRRPGQFRKH